MVKAYFRYAPRGAFGIVCANGKAIIDQTGRYIFSAAVEDVLVWSTRLSKVVFALRGKIGLTVEALELSGDFRLCAVGFSDGTVRIYTLPDEIPSGSDPLAEIPSIQAHITFSGHTSSITCLAFSKDNNMLITGSNDSDIVIWDITGERGVARLSEHLAPITCVLFISKIRSPEEIQSTSTSESASTTGTITQTSLIASSSKDGLIKLWDVSTKHCIQTLMGQGAGSKEIWSIAVDEDERILIAGGAENELRVWFLERRKKLDQEIVKDGQLRRKEDDLGDIWGESALFQPVAHFLGLLQLPEVHFGRITQIKFCTTPHSKQIIQSQSSSTSISDEPEREQRTLLGITGKTNKLVLFGVRSIKDAFHHIRRREKRQKQKIDGWNEDEEEDQNNDNDNEQKKGKSKQKEKEQLNQSTSLNITSQKTGSGLNQIQNISDLTPSDIFLVHSVITATARIDSFSFSQLQMQKSINQKKQQLDLKSLKKQRIAEQIQDSLFSADLILGLSANSMELYRVPSIISSQQQEQTNNELKGQTNDSNQTLLSPTLMQRLGITSHPSPIRFISLSEDAALLATASLGCVIVWNTATHQPIRRLITPAPTSLLFAPGSKYIIVGSSDGRLEIFDISTARLMKSLRDRGNVGQIVGQTIDPHTNSSSKVASQSSNGAIWSIVLNPDKSGVATGGAGGEINFWNFDLEFEQEEDEDDDEEDEKDDEEEEDDELERNSKIKKGKDKKKDNKKNNKGEKKKKTKKDTKMQKDQQKKPQSMSQAYLTLQYTRTLKLNDEVLCISFSPDAKIIAAGLLDNTIQLFYADTLKYALTCYGHSLPVTTIAFSDDGALLVSGGADKDVRIWSATRGDMRGKMHGHDAAVTVIIPLRGTHYFISAGRDGDIRQWDADTFECAQSLKTNKSNGTTILGLAASPDGGSVFGAGSDRCIRQWEISNEQIFRGEDQEEREEDQLEEETIRMVDEQRQGGNNQDGTIERGTAESLKGTEALIQAIEDEEKYRKAKFIDLGGEKLMQKDAVDQLEGNVGIQISDISQSSSSSSSIVSQIAPIPTVPSLLAKLQTIPTPSISAALSALPLPHARRLLQLLPKVIDDNPDTVELIHRVTHTLLTQHFTETIFGMNSQNESQIVGELGEKITEQLSKRKDIVSFNLAALGLLQRSLEEDVNKFFGAEERLREAEAAKKQRKRRSGAKR